MAAGGDGASAVVARAQGLLRAFSPELIIDGRWGTFTNGVYQSAPIEIQSAVDDLLRGQGLTAESLFAANQSEKAAGSASYLERKAAARLLREGEITRRLEGSGVATPAKAVSSSVVDEAIRLAAAHVGVDEDLLRKMVRIESGGRINAANGSSRGLTQMQPAAWLDASKLVHLGPYASAVWDPYQNVLAGAAYAKVNMERLKRYGFNEPITASVLYLAHQQGAGGFVELWRHARGLPSRTNYVSARAMQGNPPPDKGGVTTDKAAFFRRWMAYVDRL